MVDNIENRPSVELVPSAPFSVKDLPRFGQLQETAKDVFIKEITDFFDYSLANGMEKINAVPNIQKFAFGSDPGKSGLETITNLIIAYGDTLDKFPMISITSSSLRERKMGLGSNFAAQVQYPPRVIGTTIGPFDLSTINGTPSVVIQTTPQPGIIQTSTILFDTSLFVDPSSVTIDNLVQTINKTQALYYSMSRTSQGSVAIEAGGIGAPYANNSITIVSGNTQLISLFGLTVGDTDTYENEDNPLKNRHGVAADMVINIDVVCDSINTRVELSDLVFAFFGYYMDQKAYQFYGRSYFDRDITSEFWHISLKNQFSWSGEINKPRQGGEQYEHIYAVRGSVPIFIEDFIDKKVTSIPVWVDPDNAFISRAVEDVDTTGDYFGPNYKR